MAIKNVDVPGIGTVKLTKRKGTKNLRLRLAANGEVIVSMPTWLPYAAGQKFAAKNRVWIEKHAVPKKFLSLNMPVGRLHSLDFVRTDKTTPRAIVANARITVHVPNGHTIRSENVQAAALRGARKALQSEGNFLKSRLRQLSFLTGLSFGDTHLKFMKSKWGSCRNDRSITLNYRLLDLPDELVDYVIIHELAHTKHMNHSADFWALVAKHLPDFKSRRKQLKAVQLTW